MNNRERHHHRGKTSEGQVDATMVLEELRLRPGQSVLDAGCGDGYMAKAFAREVGAKGRVIALDPDEAAIARLRGETKGTNLEAIVGDITRRTALPAGSVDLMYLSNVFHGFAPDELPGFRAEVERLLRPLGRLAVVEFIKEATPCGPPLEIRCSPSEMRQLIPLTPLGTVGVGKLFYMQIFVKEGRDS